MTDWIPEGPLCITARFHSTKWKTFSWIYLGKLTNCLHPKPIRGPPFQFSSSIANINSTGILTCCPSPTPFGLGLGPTNPGRTNLPQETLDLRRQGFSPCFSLLNPRFSLPVAPVLLTVYLLCNWNARLPLKISEDILNPLLR